MTQPRATERLRLLRETTNRITRSANDAIHAYARARRAVDRQLERSKDVEQEAALALRARLHAARRDLLRALEAANGRYPWTDATGSTRDASGTGRP